MIRLKTKQTVNTSNRNSNCQMNLTICFQCYLAGDYSRDVFESILIDQILIASNLLLTI